MCCRSPSPISHCSNAIGERTSRWIVDAHFGNHKFQTLKDQALLGKEKGLMVNCTSVMLSLTHFHKASACLTKMECVTQGHSSISKAARYTEILTEPPLTEHCRTTHFLATSPWQCLFTP